MEVGIQKEQNEAQAKHKSLGNKHAVDLKKLQGVNAQSEGIAGKNERKQTTKLNCVTGQKEAERMKASEAKVAAQKAVETAQKEAKKMEKGKRKAETSHQKERDAKKQKLTELLEAMKEK